MELFPHCSAVAVKQMQDACSKPESCTYEQSGFPSVPSLSLLRLEGYCLRESFYKAAVIPSTEMTGIMVGNYTHAAPPMTGGRTHGVLRPPHYACLSGARVMNALCGKQVNRVIVALWEH